MFKFSSLYKKKTIHCFAFRKPYGIKRLSSLIQFKTILRFSADNQLQHQPRGGL